MKHSSYFKFATSLPVLLPVPLALLSLKPFGMLVWGLLLAGVPYVLFCLAAWCKQRDMDFKQTIIFSLLLPVLFCPIASISSLLILLPIDEIFSKKAGLNALGISGFTLVFGYLYVLLALALHKPIQLLSKPWSS